AAWLRLLGRESQKRSTRVGNALPRPSGTRGRGLWPMPMYIPRAAESLPLNPTAAPNEPAPVSQARSTSLYTLGAALERDRLEHRVGRVAVAVAALRRLASERRRELEPPPRHFRQ